MTKGGNFSVLLLKEYFVQLIHSEARSLYP